MKTFSPFRYLVLISMFTLWISQPAKAQFYSASPGIWFDYQISHDIVIDESDAPGRIGKLEVGLNIPHYRVGDLKIQLTHAAPGQSIVLGTTVVLIQPKNCSNQNVNVILDDDASVDADSQCNTSSPAIGPGTAIPLESLAAFAGEKIAGTWRIKIQDVISTSNPGTLQSWSLNFTPQASSTDPNRPDSLYLNAYSDSLQLHWKASALAGLDGYHIYRQEEGGSEVLLTTTGIDTTYTDTQVEIGKAYTYRVTGINSGASTETGYSNRDTGVPNANFGNGAYFSGDSANIQIPNAPSLQQSKGTIEFWVKIEESPAGKNNGYYMIANKLDPAGQNGWSFYHDANQFAAQMKNSTTNFNLLSHTNLIDSQWHHIALAYDFTGASPTTLYIDGNQVATNSSITLSLTSNPILLGQGTANFWTDFKGAIDEFRMWDTKKSAAQITHTMRKRANGTENSLVLALNMDESTGSTVIHDGSPFNHNGTIFGDVQLRKPAETIIPTLQYITPPDFAKGLPVQESTYNLPSDFITTGDMAFSSSGDKMYIIDRSWELLAQFDLSTPFDPSSATLADTLDFSGASTHLSRGFTFDETGQHLYTVGANSTIYQYDLSTPYEIGTAIYSNISYTYSGNFLRDLAFGDQGRKVFFLIKSAVYQLSLSTPYDISTITPDNIFVSVPNYENDAASLVISPDGMRLFVTGSANDEVSQINLQRPFDIKNATNPFLSYYLEGEGAPSGLALSASGNRLFVTGDASKTVFTYALKDGTFVGDETDNGAVHGAGIIVIHGDTFTHAGAPLTNGVDYSIANLPAGLTPQIIVGDSGKVATLSLVGSATQYSKADSVSNLLITFTSSAFMGGSAAAITDAQNASSHFSIHFNTPPQVSFSSPDAVSYMENTYAAVVDVQAQSGTLPADQDISYSLTGIYTNLFYIEASTGKLYFNNAPDYENPQDTAQQNLYEVTVQAAGYSDTATQVVQIQVLDDNDNPPLILPNQVFAVNKTAPVGTVVDTVQATDEDTHTTFSSWTIVGAPASLPYSIDANTGILSVSGTLDSTQYQLQLQVSDGVFTSGNQTITINVQEGMNHAPVLDSTIPDLVLAQGFGDTTVNLGQHFSDPDSDVLQYSVQAATPNVVALSLSGDTLRISEDSLGHTDITIIANDGQAQTQTIFNVMIQSNTNTNEAPVLTLNTGLSLKKGQQAVITKEMLHVTDADNSPQELVYTLTAVPTQGQLLISDQVLGKSDTFTQEDINTGALSYRHNGQDGTSDAFSFTVSDGHGGSLAEQTFAISIEAVLGLAEDQMIQVDVYPIPAVHHLHIQLSSAYRGEVQARLLNASGRVLQYKTWEKRGWDFQQQMNLTAVPQGICYLQLIAGAHVEVIKVMKQ